MSTTPVTPPNAVHPEISQATSDAILTSMAKHPDERFANYGDFRMALEGARSLLLRVTFLEGEAEQAPVKPTVPWWKR